nr:hypothetical protein [Allomuricauda sp.]
MTEEEIINVIKEEKIRTLIQKEEKKISVIWKYLNSALGIWFLSTVGVGLISFGYAKISYNLEEKTKRNQLIAKIDTEIESRLYQFKYKANRKTDSLTINNSFNNQLYRQNTNGKSIKEYWFQLKQSPDDGYIGYYSVFPEFENRNLLSLLFELKALLRKNEEIKEIEEIIKKVISDELLPIKDTEVDKESIQEILLELRINRWKKLLEE